MVIVPSCENTLAFLLLGPIPEKRPLEGAWDKVILA
jgi:hypothetical protein